MPLGTKSHSASFHTTRERETPNPETKHAQDWARWRGDTPKLRRDGNRAARPPDRPRLKTRNGLGKNVETLLKPAQSKMPFRRESLGHPTRSPSRARCFRLDLTWWHDNTRQKWKSTAEWLRPCRSLLMGERCHDYSSTCPHLELHPQLQDRRGIFPTAAAAAAAVCVAASCRCPRLAPVLQRIEARRRHVGIERVHLRVAGRRGYDPVGSRSNHRGGRGGRTAKHKQLGAKSNGPFRRWGLPCWTNQTDQGGKRQQQQH